LRWLIRAVLSNFESKYRHQRHQSRLLTEVSPLLEHAIREELAEFLLKLLRQERQEKIRGDVPLETVAQAMSWAIFGTALQWSRELNPASLESMVDHLFVVIVEGGVILDPEELLE